MFINNMTKMSNMFQVKAQEPHTRQQLQLKIEQVTEIDVPVSPNTKILATQIIPNYSQPVIRLTAGTTWNNT